MSEQVLAAVRTAPSTTELREFPLPELPDDGALMRVEVAGICGTDVKMYAKPPFGDPVIMGHENVGTIANAGEKFKQLHGVAAPRGRGGVGLGDLGKRRVDGTRQHLIGRARLHGARHLELAFLELVCGRERGL